MGLFWSLAGALMALVIALLSWPLLRHREMRDGASRRAINTAIYRDQLAELERDRASGALAAEDFARAREELEKRILEDTLEDQDGQGAAVQVKGVPKTAILLLGLIPALSLPLYFTFGNPKALEANLAVPAHNQEITPQMVEEMVGKLQQRLAEHPEDSKGWVMLGRSLGALGRFDEAENAFAKAGPAMDSEPPLILEQVRLSTARNNGRVVGKAQELLNKLLKQDPDNGNALFYAGASAYFSGKYLEAASFWERLRKLVEPGSEDARNLALGIAKAQALAARKAPVPANLPWDEEPAPAQPNARSAAKQSPQVGATLSGRVELAPALKAKTEPGDTVFVFARAVQGPRMPLAVIRTKVAELPLNFTLDDSMAMSPELRLSQAADVNLEVRVSKSGDAIAKSGDLVGKAGPLKPGAKDIKIIINTVMP